MITLRLLQVSHNISEASETDEQTPMLPKRTLGGGAQQPGYMMQPGGGGRSRPDGIDGLTISTLPANNMDTLPSQNQLRYANCHRVFGNFKSNLRDF